MNNVLKIWPVLNTAIMPPSEIIVSTYPILLRDGSDDFFHRRSSKLRWV